MSLTGAKRGYARSERETSDRSAYYYMLDLFTSGVQTKMAWFFQIGDRMALINRSIFHLVLLQACLLVGQASYSIARADEQGWVLTQRSKSLGDQYVYISPSGVKVQNAQQGVGTVVRAPNWDVLFFNDKSRLYFSMSYQQWKTKLAANKAKIPPANWVTGRSGSIAGLKATQYVMKNAARPRGPNDWVSAEYWVANDIKVNPRLSELLSTAYGTPDNSCVPLRLSYRTAAGKTGMSLDTYREQATSIPTSYYNGPNGYQLAKSEVDVMMTNENRQIMNDIANDLGSTETNRAGNHIPAGGLKLPNGKTVSKDQITKFVDELKARQHSGSGQ
jgi:hypothetical protein